MRRLWHDFQAHKWAAALLLVYWLATLAVSFVTWYHGIPGRVVVLLLTTPLVAGFLVGRWRAPTPEHAAHSRDRIGGGVLAGVLSAEITLLVMRGGVVEEVIGWMLGWQFFGQWGEVLGFTIAAGILGAVLGLAGAVIAMILDHVRRRTGTLGRSKDK
jgi:hypothetical protein